MNKEAVVDGKGNARIYLKGFIFELIISLIFIFLFSIIMYFASGITKYAPILATISVGIGAFVGSFIASKKIGSNGIVTGIIIGGITFVLITIISLIVNKGGITFNTLFHLIIFMLSSIIGGILGVNSKSDKNII